MANDQWFEQLAEEVGTASEPVPAALKSKVYSAIVARMSESGRLLDLSTTKRAGGHLCVFEHAVALLPVGTDLKSRNPCRVCHARVLGERMDHAPIFWPGCPYSEFHNG
jgi:hypothetical protein